MPAISLICAYSFLREQQEKVNKEARVLKQRVEILEKENAALKKSLYDLSAKYNLYALKAQPFTLDFLVAETGIGDLFESTTAAASGADEVYAPTTIRDVSKDSRQFMLKYELKGHSGAVYAVQFSPCGKFLASGSFDKTVRVWDAMATQKEMHCFKKHTLNISDLCWSTDSTELLSGGYDQTCNIWDLENGKLADSFETDGFVQCVMFNPQDQNIFFNGTSRNILGMVDRRKPGEALSIKNSAMINSIYVYRDGSYVMAADHAGAIKTWDYRMGKSVLSIDNPGNKKPISHITVCQQQGSDDEPRYMAVNSYDNVIRVYDRGFTPPTSAQRLIHSLKGHKNKNWPIKSSFFHYRDGQGLGSAKRANSHSDLLYLKDSETESSDGNRTNKDKSAEPNILLATGSSDPSVYIYSVGGAEGTSELVQKLEGHTDRVYAVNFHPTEALLASCSADSTIKMWYSSRKKN
ncbi:WD40-repeat-containing domain protein [Polychytrium aggregatum]|uniref:WD40-repeat-containing domain protein n=1 Tax=Polychytrium aggregatum TaxID=110093 RepID=UPI0022FEF6E5|nr:WD40-repeat-containing domain protein [Polychytrium aggregatum]KAI9209632.1 WD40-repeat-containing domain protein [Polychytrium aggregatum]